MNEEGPIREEAFQYRVELINLTDFLKKEGYDDKEILDALKEEKSKQNNLMLRTVRRMQHYNSDLYLKPKVFDKWMQFVHLRKLFKYWLGFADKKGEFIQSDKHWAFDKWKKYYPASKDTL